MAPGIFKAQFLIVSPTGIVIIFILKETMAQSLSHLPKVIWLVCSRVGFGAQVFQDPDPVLFHCTPLPLLRKVFKIKRESFEFQNLRKNSSEYLHLFFFFLG